MASGPLITLAILQYIQAWNEYFWRCSWPATAASACSPWAGHLQVADPQGTPDWAGLMAATLMAALPIVVLFAVFSRRIVDSIGFSRDQVRTGS